LTVEDDVKNSGLSENLQKQTLDFIAFMKENGLLIEPENDENGWQILYTDECVGHMNFANAGIWIDTCDFGGGGSADDALKESAWAHVRGCEHYSSGGKQCGCGNQPGFNRTIFGKKYENLCFSHLEFMDFDAETLGNIKKLILLFIQNKSGMQHS